MLSAMEMTMVIKGCWMWSDYEALLLSVSEWGVKFSRVNMEMRLWNTLVTCYPS